ncbi:MAG: hypothetical protein IPM38_02845 [Ignavibacteria bacterium]|nr:hypothetical protein [Ignavibacteria bacterium]
MIDPSISAPIISNLIISSDTIFTNSAFPNLTFYTSVNVNLNEGAPLDYVRCSITDPSGNSIASVQLFDNGTFPDTTSATENTALS